MSKKKLSPDYDVTAPGVLGVLGVFHLLNDFLLSGPGFSETGQFPRRVQVVQGLNQSTRNPDISKNLKKRRCNVVPFV